MLHYLAPFLAFGAALLGIFGDTQDATKRGLRRLTCIGWLTVSLAIVSLLFGLWQTWQQTREQRLLAAQRAQLAEIAKRELCAASLHLKAAFDMLYAATGATLPGGRDLGFPFEMLTRPTTLLELNALDLLGDPAARPGAQDRRPVWSLVHHRTDAFWTRTSMVLAKYGPFMDPSLVVLASQLLNDNYVQWLLELQSNVEHMRQVPNATLPSVEPLQNDEYVTSIGRLNALMNQTGGDGEQPACQSITELPPG